ncbi:GerAB/ArcD/ProY family transporter [Metabacillus schmidteae]|uniref:GerAB/ArcD/ProY family transporter n=1 Tax=Metabacillus schmidteae TaxID=2730405 RepID=UPI001F414CE6|nr:GerAB/ArcD/ProY family transporter [Metabacillus schmidteae]
MEKITKSQLFSLMLLYEVGSTTLFALGIGAKQDAWIVILIATMISLGLVWIFTELQKQYPDKNLVEILQILLGKWLSVPLILLYALYFFSSASFNFYEFGEIIRTTFLVNTPQLVILGVFMFTSIYMITLGFEVIARTGEILMPVLIIFLFTTYFLASISGALDLQEILPVLENGIKPVLKEVLPVVNFPFGESVVFLLYWHMINKKESIRKIALLVICITGVILILTNLMIITMLGPELAAKAEIPLLRVLFDINIADIVTNLDIIGVIVIFIGGFYKTVLNFYASVLAVSTLFKWTNKKWLTIIMGLGLIVYSVTYFENISFHRWIGFEFNTNYLHGIFGSLPILILMLTWLKSKTNNQKLKR